MSLQVVCLFVYFFTKISFPHHMLLTTSSQTAILSFSMFEVATGANWYESQCWGGPLTRSGVLTVQSLGSHTNGLRQKGFFSRDATAGWLFIFFFAVGTDMKANGALIHSLCSHVTKVHSHISLNISKFQSFLKIVSNFSPCWSTHQVLAWLECTVTGINWATSCVQTPIKHSTASPPALSE